MPKPADDPTRMSVMDDGSPKIVCQHCGGWFAVSLPIEVVAYAAMIKAFTRAHRVCSAEQPAPGKPERLPQA